MDWETGDGLLAVDDPSLVEAAFERGENHVGIAVVGLSLNCDEQESVTRFLKRTVDSEDRETSRLGFTALGHAVRRFRKMNPAIEEILFRFRESTLAEVAMDDVLQYVPFLNLPFWLKAKSFRRSLKWIFVERWR